jgi:hypothetical protein
MARKRPKPARTPPADRRVIRHFLRIALTLAAAGAVAAGVVWFGSRAGEHVAGHPRYAVPFAEIQCDAPPGSTRAAFLSEVRYLANAPETVQAVDPGLGDTLAPVFRQHPWVEDVEGVEVTADRAVRVRLRFRTPVLLVRVAGGEPAQRLVDAKGVLLPPVPPPEGVAVLANERPPPGVAAGRVWDDAVVTRAAALARDFTAVRVEKTDTGWRVTQATGRVLAVSW